MTVFIRLLESTAKDNSLIESLTLIKNGSKDKHIFEVNPSIFNSIPNSPFAYWVSKRLINIFSKYKTLESDTLNARVTNPIGDDPRFFRSWWEIREIINDSIRWIPISKGGSFSPYYYDMHLVVKWNSSRTTFHGFIGTQHRPLEKPASVNKFFRAGITWPRRTSSGISMRILPNNCIFADKSPSIFESNNSLENLLTILAEILHLSSPWKRMQF